MATKEMTLTELRKEASSLGIKNYAKYSKEVLFEMIKAAEGGVKISSEPEFENEVPVNEVTGEIDPSVDFMTQEEKLIAEKIATQESRVVGIIPAAIQGPKAQAFVKEKKTPKIKEDQNSTKESRQSARILSEDIIEAILKLKNENVRTGCLENKEKPKEGSQSETIYNAILANPREPLSQIAKQNGCYYSSVQRVAEKYFGMSFCIKTRKSNDVAPQTSTEK